MCSRLFSRINYWTQPSLVRNLYANSIRLQQASVTNQPVSQKTAPVQPPLQSKKSKFTRKVGVDFVRIWTSYLLITIGGITLFYFAKKEVDQSRQNAMKLKKEIFTNEDAQKYPSRRDVLEAEKRTKQN
jgi:hypothetical protein